MPVNPSVLPSLMLCLTLLSGLSLPAIGETPPMILTGPDLRPRLVRVQSLGDGLLTYFDPGGRLQSEPLEAFLRLESLETAEVPRPLPEPGKGGLVLVGLNDRQRLAGQGIGPGPGEGSGFVLRGTLVGDVPIALERLSWLQRLPVDEGPGRDRQAPPDPGEPTDDRLIFANGDYLSGFIERVDGQSVRIEVQDGSRIDVGWDRIARLHLANPPRPQAGQSEHLVCLVDGTCLRTDEPRLARQRLRLQASLSPSGEPLDLPLKALQRIDVAQSRYRLAGLSELAWRTIGGGSAFGLPLRPRRQGEDLLLHAPVAVSVDLPAEARRFSGRLVLSDPQAWRGSDRPQQTERTGEADDEAPPSDEPDREAAGPERDLSWADLTVRVVLGGEVVLTQRLNADQPGVRLNLPLSGSRLILALDPAVNGPVLDRVRLVEPVVLLDSQP